RVFAEDGVGLRERACCAHREVIHVSDRRADDDEAAATLIHHRAKIIWRGSGIDSLNHLFADSLPIVERRSTPDLMTNGINPVGYHARVTMLLAAVLIAASQAQGALLDFVAASVNDDAIAESDVRKAMAVSPMRPQTGETPQAYR